MSRQGKQYVDLETPLCGHSKGRCFCKVLAGDTITERERKQGEDVPTCFFVTDLHGRADRYDKLLTAIVKERPAAVFVGGDLLPHGMFVGTDGGLVGTDFLEKYLAPAFAKARDALGPAYPDIFLILGNDDLRSEEEGFEAAAARGLWRYAHGRKLALSDYAVYGYACVPPTPFLLKDWERYDVSRYVPPGSVSPEDGRRSVAVDETHVRWATIQRDLEELTGEDSFARAVFLFHTPPCDTPLDRAGLDGKKYEHVPLDLHIGSIAVRRFIEQRQPLLTLHGHVHESTRLTGEWKIRLGRTVCINGAHDGPELALVRFDLESPWGATRELL